MTMLCYCISQPAFCVFTAFWCSLHETDEISSSPTTKRSSTKSCWSKCQRNTLQTSRKSAWDLEEKYSRILEWTLKLKLPRLLTNLQAKSYISITNLIACRIITSHLNIIVSVTDKSFLGQQMPVMIFQLMLHFKYILFTLIYCNEVVVHCKMKIHGKIK